MLRGNDGLQPVPFSSSWVEKETLLYRFLTKKIDIPIKFDHQGSILVNTPTQHLQILRKYLLTGEVLLDDLQILVKELDYWGIYSLKAEYPPEYLLIKFEEDWYRRNLYHPEFAQRIGENHGLILLNNEVMQQFPYINDLHYLYPKKIYYDVPKVENLDTLMEKPGINIDKNDNEPIYLDGYYIHSFNRPYVKINNKLDKIKKEITSKVHEVQKKIKLRDDNFENVLREAVNSRRPIATGGVNLKVNDDNFEPISLEYYRSFDYIMIDLSEDPILDLLASHRSNICLAGGFVLNKIIDCRQGSSSDYDIFIYGLNEEQANDKIAGIIRVLKTNMKDFGTNVIYLIRSENAITIKMGKYRIQIILRLYKNISEIIHGFDVDCCCVAYDWGHIWMTKRAEYALKHMINFVDFDRMSPTYELRLNKYSQRGFSIYIPYFDSAKVDYSAIHQFAETIRKYRKSDRDPSKEYAKLKGLDLLLYGYLYHLPKVMRSQSDYSQPPPYLSDAKVSTENVRIDLFVKENKEVYAFKYSLGRRQEIDINLILNTPIPQGYKMSVPPQLKWKTINPGEQTTGTFHRLVLENISVFYQGMFYSGPLP